MGGFKTPEVDENVTPNLIPMIDVMFLLLLFFMLSADMTQRELENVVLPKADQAREDTQTRERFGRTTVNIHLRDQTLEPKDMPVEYLQDEKNWIVAIRSRAFNDWSTIKMQLEEEGKQDLEDQIDPVAKIRLSGRTVQIRADQYAPYGVVQKVIETAGLAGLYKVEVAASRPSPDK